jgi:hypothetical protein
MDLGPRVGSANRFQVFADDLGGTQLCIGLGLDIESENGYSENQA